MPFPPVFQCDNNWRRHPGSSRNPLTGTLDFHTDGCTAICPLRRSGSGTASGRDGLSDFPIANTKHHSLRLHFATVVSLAQQTRASSHDNFPWRKSVRLASAKDGNYAPFSSVSLPCAGRSCFIRNNRRSAPLETPPAPPGLLSHSLVGCAPEYLH